MKFFINSNLIEKSASIPVYIYRFSLVLSMLVLAVMFTAANDGYCTEAALFSVQKKESSGCLDFWLNRYQSLIAGFLALLGAAFAFKAVRDQIAQTERLSELAKRRKEDATTSVAPFALSSMVDYAWQCMDTIVRARNEVVAGTVHPTFHPPTLPRDIIQLLKDYVEYGDEKHAKSGSILLYATQIQSSRIHSLKQKTAISGPGLYTDAELQDAMFDALDLHAQVSAMFRPIRRDYGERTFWIENMYNDLRVRGIELNEWDRLKWKIEAFQKVQAGRAAEDLSK